MSHPIQPAEETEQECVIPRPYESLSNVEAVWLRDQLDIINERVSDIYAHDYDAIPADLDAVNSAYIALEMELAWRGIGLDEDGE